MRLKKKKKKRKRERVVEKENTFFIEVKDCHGLVDGTYSFQVPERESDVPDENKEAKYHPYVKLLRETINGKMEILA